MSVLPVAAVYDRARSIQHQNRSESSCVVTDRAYNRWGISLLAGLATVVFLAGTHFITGVLCANDNLMPLAVVRRMIRIISDGVLTAKFGGNFVQHLVDGVGVGRTRRNQPRFGSACRSQH